jgi:hypothetical protein
MVLEISGNEIFTKSGLNNPDNYKFLSFLMLMSPDGSTFIENLFKGSKEAGVSAGKILFYISKLPEYAVIVPVADRAAFEKWLKKAEAPEPLHEAAFSYILTGDGNPTIAWNDSYAMLLGASTVEKIAEHFNPKTDGLLAVSDDFHEFTKTGADIRMWIQYGGMINMYESLLFMHSPIASGLNSDLFANMKDFAQLSLHSYLNFEDGKITGKSVPYPSEEIRKLKEKFPVLKNSLNTEIIKDMPERSYLAFNLSINVQEYFKLIRQNIETILLKQYEHALGSEERIDEMSEFLDSPELKSVIDALAGDLLVSLHGFNQGMFSYPLASASFTVNGEDGFNSILKLIPQDLYRKQDGYYSTVTSKTLIPVYFAYKNNRVFVSNDLNATNVFTGKQKEKTFADNPVGKLMTDRMLFYINLDYETYPDNLKMLAQNFMGSRYGTFTSVMDIYESMYFSSSTDYSMEFSLQLKNKNVNSLKQILTNIDKLVSSSAWTN